MAHDPNATHQGPSRLGGVGAPNQAAEFGVIVDAQVDRYTYTVRTMSGRAMQGVPRKRMSPSDKTILSVGTSVIVRYDLGIPIIDGILDMPAEIATTPGISVTDMTGYGGQGFNQATNTQIGTFRGPDEPTDLLPGDSIMANASGARVGILEGGTAVLAGSSAAQVRVYSLNDLVELFGRNFRHVSDMGIQEIKNTDGRINWSFRGASDQVSEAAASEENWTIRFDMGSEGDVLDLRLTTPQGRDLFRFHVDSEGRCQLMGMDGLILQSGNTSGQAAIYDHAGDLQDGVTGDRSVTTGGDASETTQGSETHTTDGDMAYLSGNDARWQASRDLALTAGRNAFLTAMGARDGSPGMSVNVYGGHYETVVGQPTYPAPNYSVKTYKGKVSLESSMGGPIELTTLLGEINGSARKVTFNTQGPDSVILGGNVIAGHVAKFEPLVQVLRVMAAVFDAHAHPAPGTAPPTTPMSATIAGMLQSIKSLRVGVGA